MVVHDLGTICHEKALKGRHGLSSFTVRAITSQSLRKIAQHILALSICHRYGAFWYVYHGIHLVGIQRVGQSHQAARIRTTSAGFASSSSEADSMRFCIKTITSLASTCATLAIMLALAPHAARAGLTAFSGDTCNGPIGEDVACDGSCIPFEGRHSFLVRPSPPYKPSPSLSRTAGRSTADRAITAYRCS